MLDRLKSFWRGVRRLSGDDAYEQYLKHYDEYHSAEHHPSDEPVEPPLSKEAFFKQWQDNKWKGVKRCC